LLILRRITSCPELRQGEGGDAGRLRVRAAGGERDANAASAFDDADADYQEALANGGELGVAETAVHHVHALINVRDHELGQLPIVSAGGWRSAYCLIGATGLGALVAA
jgi:hypothetical protein